MQLYLQVIVVNITNVFFIFSLKKKKIQLIYSVVFHVARHQPIA